MTFKIPPRPILIKHGSKIGLFTVNKKIYGLYYKHKKIIRTDLIINNLNPERTIKNFIEKATKDSKEYKSKVTEKEIIKQRTKNVIKKYKEVIKNKNSNGELDKPIKSNEHYLISKILTENNIKPEYFFKVKKLEQDLKLINKTKTKEDIIKAEQDKKDKEDKQLKELNKEVSEHYNNNIIDYAMHKSRYLIISESKNIAKQILMSFMVATQTKSLFNDIHGRADTGKSYIFDTALNYYIPKEFIIKLNSSTVASFINKCKDNPHYFNSKIIYLGDLGNKETYERMKHIFNILKIVISEGEYTESKNEKTGKEWTPVDIKISGTIGAYYCTVFEDHEDKTNQLQSRAITSTPAQVSKNDKILFKLNTKITGTQENINYNNTIKELEKFKIYFKKTVKDYLENNYKFINPFFMTFNNMIQYGITETRELDNINDLFKSYCMLNKDICFNFSKTINNETVNYIVPKLDLVQKFINIVHSSIGLKQYEKNLLLLLKEKLIMIDSDTANDLYNEIDENEHIENYKTDYQLIKETFKILFLRYGYNTKKTNTKIKNNEYMNKEIFFRSTDIKQKHKQHKNIKDIENLNSTLINLANRGFLERLEHKYNRANVYYLNKGLIQDIKKDYNLKNEDLDTAKQYLNNLLTTNQDTKETETLLTKQELKEIFKNYQIDCLIGLQDFT